MNERIMNEERPAEPERSAVPQNQNGSGTAAPAHRVQEESSGPDGDRHANCRESVPEKHVISLLVSNKPGVLIRISLVFALRGYNIESLAVSPSHDPRFSRMTITATGDRKTLDQILKQVNKLVDVMHARDHTGDNYVERELVLIKVSFSAEKRTEILQIADHFKCHSVDISRDAITFEATGTSDKLNALQVMLEPYGILESVRSGKLIVARGLDVT